MKDISALHLEGLREAVNIGSCHGATALSTVLNHTVSIEVPSLRSGDREKVIDGFKHLNIVARKFLFLMMGDLQGYVIFSVPQERVEEFRSMLWRDAGVRRDDDSMLEEAANIISASFVSAIANFLGVILFQSIPAVSVGNVRDKISALLTDASANEWILSVEVKLIIDGPDSITAALLCIPDEASVKTMIAKLDRLLG